MSDQITTAFIQQYKAGWEHLVQQRGSKLRDCVRNEDQVGKAAFYDQIGSTTVSDRTVRHGDSPYIPTPHSRRMCVLQDKHWGDFVDEQDKLRTLNDPTNPYVQAGAMAMGRAMDQILVDAMGGTAFTGEDGSTSVAFGADGGETVVHNSVGLTLEKILEAKRRLDDNEADEGERFFVCTAFQLEDLLAIEKLTSADYATVKALVSGEINTFCGFNFKRLSSAIMPKVSTTRTCYAFTRDAMVLALGIEPMATIERRADKGFAWYVYNRMSIGSTRMQGEKIVAVEATE